jgi:hypothetical protein
MAVRVAIVTAAAEPSPKGRSHDISVFPGGAGERLVTVLAHWTWRNSTRWLREVRMTWLTWRTALKQVRVGTGRLDIRR